MTAGIFGKRFQWWPSGAWSWGRGSDEYGNRSVYASVPLLGGVALFWGRVDRSPTAMARHQAQVQAEEEAGG
jgi:hypothetical protein